MPRVAHNPVLTAQQWQLVLEHQVLIERTLYKYVRRSWWWRDPQEWKDYLLDQLILGAEAFRPELWPNGDFATFAVWKLKQALVTLKKRWGTNRARQRRGQATLPDGDLLPMGLADVRTPPAMLIEAEQARSLWQAVDGLPVVLASRVRRQFLSAGRVLANPAQQRTLEGAYWLLRRRLRPASTQPTIRRRPAPPGPDEHTVASEAAAYATLAS